MTSEIDLFLEYLLNGNAVYTARREEYDKKGSRSAREVYLLNIANYYEIGPAATQEEIADFEALQGVKLPSDIKEYFLKINGADEGFFGLRS
jgi:hypothetical protein